MALATVDELQARIGEASLDATDLARAEAVLEDASELVLNIGNRSWTAADGTNPAPRIAVVVTLRLAARMWNNPEDLSYEALGDHTVSRRGAAGLLTADERELVLQAANFTPGVYSVSMPGVGG